MWKCPQCGREFAHVDQSRFCGEPANHIDEYIAAQPEGARPYLVAIRDTIRAALPDAQERISWGMPTYWKTRNVIHFAAYKRHIGLYPGEKAVEHFSDRLREYRTSKGTVQFPYDKPLPLDLISEMAKWCHEMALQSM